MDLIKSTKFGVVAGLLLFLIGIGIGLLVNNVPYITFKNDVDLGTCIAILGLVVTIFIMPFIVQRKLSRQDNINAVILIDIETINSDVTALREIYVELKSSTQITKEKYRKIIASFKTISAEISSVAEELEARKRLTQFKKDVYDTAYNHAYEVCTDPLVIDGKLNDSTILEANRALNSLCAALRKYRYETFA